MVDLDQRDIACVMVTIFSVEGSAPRDAHTKMIITRDAIFDTIGGGNLEYQAIQKSREMLEAGQPTIHRQSVSLGKDLTQCCGGKVELLFELIAAKDFNVVIFGAGHVGKALVKILSDLHLKILWFDNRPEIIEDISSQHLSNDRLLNDPLSNEIGLQQMDNPEFAVEKCPANANYIVITHSHDLDQQLVEAILSRGDCRFCGLIGSKSKAAKFKSRLKRKQFSENEIAQLTSPIGLPQIPGKHPVEVAVSIAAQLITLKNAH